MVSKKSVKRVIEAKPNGLLVYDPAEFLSKTKKAIQRELGLQFADIERIAHGSSESCYIRTSGAEKVNIDGKPYSAVRLLTADTSMWLVVEIDWEAGKPALVHHVSLKVHEGKTSDTAKLCFRAEWDLRDHSAAHAQPHWNIHSPTDVPEPPRELDFNEFADLTSEETFASFIDGLDQVDPDQPSVPPVGVPELIFPGFTASRMHEFHFAMSAPWAAMDGGHSPLIESPDQLVNWMTRCAKYIRAEMEFVRS